MAHNPNWFQSVEKKPIPKAPAFSKTLQIDDVVSGSPAADLNLRQGDKLLSVNGKAAIIADIPNLLANSSSVKYRFFLPRDSAFLEVSTTGLPLGIKTSVSSDGIAEQYKSKGEFETQGLLTLWERGDYDRIRAACAVSNKRLNKKNLLGKLVGKPKSFPFTKMMLAICDIEEGKQAAGYKALGEFGQNQSAGYTSDVQAVLNYYHALNLKAENRPEAYANLMEEAHRSYPESIRIRDAALKVGAKIDLADGRIGRQVDTMREWTFLEGGQGSTSLQDVLDELPKGQVLPLCLMTAYRGNGPYNEALLPYIALQPHISERLAPLTVLTHVAEKRKDRPHWNSNEDLAKKMNCPLIVLHSSFEEIVEGFSVQFAPEFFVLDKTGTIVWTGPLATDYDYWDMLDKVGG